MTITINKWTSHHNQLMYSLLYYCDLHNIDFKIKYSSKIHNNGIVLKIKGTLCFLDYSDGTNFIEDPKKFNYYFKRSLTPNSVHSNIRPLNFQVNFSFKPLKLISKMPQEILIKNTAKVEVARALDFLNIFTKDSHQSKTIKKLWSNEISDNGGRIIFMTRLWDPARNKHQAEKERRILQNNFRINACRIISKNFPNSITGIYPDYYAKEVAKDVLLDVKQTKKRNYLSELKRSDICIADDGLKDTPGWKIGEYAMLNKAIISTPIKTVVENFNSGENYSSLINRNDYKSIPDVINDLIKTKKYLDLKENNKIWSNQYLKPDAYISNIINNCN